MFIKIFFFLYKAIFELTEASKRWNEVENVLVLRQKRSVRMERKLTGLKDSAVL